MCFEDQKLRGKVRLTQVYTSRQFLMATASSWSDEPSTIEAGVVPFVGWSSAALEFRIKTAEFAPAGTVRPLFIGDPGVGKKTMARAWMAACSHDNGLEFVDLDYRSRLTPGRYIGVTTYHPTEGQYVQVLGREVRERISREGRVPGIVDFFWDYFDLALYMPPLRAGREIDVLAFLEYWHRCRARRAGLRYLNIADSLLQQMIFGTWPNNLDSIYVRLRMLCNADRLKHAGKGNRAEVVEIETLCDDQATGRITEAAAGNISDDRGAHGRNDEGISFDSLRDLAVRMYLWCCQQDPYEPSSLARMPLDRFRSGLTARGFQQLTEERFIREHVLLGVPPSLAERPDYFMALLDRLRNPEFFGTTFPALQAGLAIDPIRCDELLGGLGRPSSRSLVGLEGEDGLILDPSDVTSYHESDGANQSLNQFSSDGKNFHIRFCPALNRIERGTFPREGNIGLAYYHHLIRRSGVGTSPLDLERGIGKLVADVVRDEAFDETAWKQIRERLDDIEEELDRAERNCDLASQERLQREREQINKLIEQAHHKGVDKGLDMTAKKARDRVRKAMKDARIRLKDDKMFRLCDYLEKTVRYRKGSWTYHPTKASKDWLT